LIGHGDHAEVIGTTGQINAPIHLVSTVEDVAALPMANDAPIAYITQTTLSVDETRDVIAALNRRFADVVGPDVADICYATQNRQTAVRELARRSDLLIVVGSRNSSNSNRLKEIGTEMGVPSYLIDDGSDLDPAWFVDAETVGVTAGASAPESLVENVLQAIAAIRPVVVTDLEGVAENMEFNLPAPLRRPNRALAV
jgi:4-hydroxy-3-methylbut-2-enyl diphosphate reductase